MLREKKIEEIYDGHFYGSEDMVPVGVSGCAGCSACCRNTGDSIILDPYDMYMLQKGTGKTFEEMIEREIEIRLVDGLILPNLMQHHGPSPHEQAEDRSGRKADAGIPGSGTAEEDHCPFLSAAGRCSIHPWRPGFCRLYPMGRYYTEEGFRYILQKDECVREDRTPVLLRDWIGIEDLPRYEAWVLDWHAFRRRAETAVERLTPRSFDSVTRYILQIFFVHPYETGADFYPQYGARMEVCREALSQIL